MYRANDKSWSLSWQGNSSENPSGLVSGAITVMFNKIECRSGDILLLDKNDVNVASIQKPFIDDVPEVVEAPQHELYNLFADLLKQSEQN